jgi:hypothetical protein
MNSPRGFESNPLRKMRENRIAVFIIKVLG